LRYNANWNRSFRGQGGVNEVTTEDSYEVAAARLERALSRLDASVRSLNGRTRALARIEADTQKLMSERSRLAAELDKEAARAKRLDDSAADVSRRLIAAMETVRGVLAK
jgi:ABC-type transporter Mla subunit MlaD